MGYTSGALLEDHIRMVDEETIARGPEAIKYQLRANRLHAIQAWQSGGNTKSVWTDTRWGGDDGRNLSNGEERFWRDAQRTAQQARFDELDAAYEKAKKFHGVE